MKKKSKIVVHLSLDDLRDLGVIKKIYKRRKRLQKVAKDTYDLGYKNNPDPNIYNKQYPNYFQNTSNLNNENIRLQNDKLAQDMSRNNLINNDETDNKIRHLEDFKNKAINWFQSYNIQEPRFEELEDDDDDNQITDDNFHSQENNFNTPYKPDANDEIDDEQNTSIKRLQPLTEEIKNELDDVITPGSVKQRIQRYQSKTKVTLLKDSERGRLRFFEPDDEEDKDEEIIDDERSPDKQIPNNSEEIHDERSPNNSEGIQIKKPKTSYKHNREELNKILRALGVTDQTILGSNTKTTKMNAINKIKRDQIVAKYHILGGFKNTNGKSIEGMNKLIKEQISILENPTEKQKNIISDYYKNNE